MLHTQNCEADTLQKDKRPLHETCIMSDIKHLKGSHILCSLVFPLPPPPPEITYKLRVLKENHCCPHFEMGLAKNKISSAVTHTSCSGTLSPFCWVFVCLRVT